MSAVARRGLRREAAPLDPRPHVRDRRAEAHCSALHAPAFALFGLAVVTDLAVAAVALTIQLAIDMADRDPADMRALELERVCEDRAEDSICDPDGTDGSK